MVHCSRRGLSHGRDSSEEGRKPTVSPVNEHQTPLRLLVLRPNPVFEADRPFPAHLAEILEEWHKENGAERPPLQGTTVELYYSVEDVR
jgi:hypothetical protein